MLLLILFALGLGAPAPPFALNGVGFGEAATGRSAKAPTVIAFLDFSESRRTGTGAVSTSRAEADAVRSLWTTSKAAGLRVVLVDASPTVHGRTSSVAELESCVGAWELHAFPVIQDDESAGLARRYGVTRTPTVFLLDGSGIVRGRWDEFVPAADLAPGLDALR
jgi:hypothetical protein